MKDIRTEISNIITMRTSHFASNITVRLCYSFFISTALKRFIVDNLMFSKLLSNLTKHAHTLREVLRKADRKRNINGSPK